ncbi:MAG TPA: DMT family transporter [Motilibacteraceae bacterium]|nr:DMT family transporter [Motilibacteraceae bacterium]
MLVVVIPLTLLAALLYAMSDFLEQRAASGAGRQVQVGEDGSQPPLLRWISKTFRKMVRDKRWLLGWVVGTVAYLVQGAALHEGSVSVVQALQVTTLLFALPLSTVGRPESPSRRDWLAGAAVCGGLALFLYGRGHANGDAQAHRGAVLFVLMILVGAVVTLVALAASTKSGPARAALLACAAGAGFASSATLVKLTSIDLTTVGVAGTATDWVGYALALATGTGLLLQQAAFAAGRLATATTVMTVTNPLVGTAIAAVGFGELLPSSGSRLAAVVLGGLLIAAGVTGLSHSRLLRPSDEPAPERRPLAGQHAVIDVARWERAAVCPVPGTAMGTSMGASMDSSMDPPEVSRG